MDERKPYWQEQGRPEQKLNFSSVIFMQLMRISEAGTNLKASFISAVNTLEDLLTPYIDVEYTEWKGKVNEMTMQLEKETMAKNLDDSNKFLVDIEWKRARAKLKLLMELIKRKEMLPAHEIDEMG